MGEIQISHTPRPGCSCLGKAALPEQTPPCWMACASSPRCQHTHTGEAATQTADCPLGVVPGPAERSRHLSPPRFLVTWCRRGEGQHWGQPGQEEQRCPRHGPLREPGWGARRRRCYLRSSGVEGAAQAVHARGHPETHSRILQAAEILLLGCSLVAEA